MVHMQKKHGFFIPDVEYLKDPKGLLMRVGLKVDVFFVFFMLNTLLLKLFWLKTSSSPLLSGQKGISLACTVMRDAHPFQSLEAVRKQAYDCSGSLHIALWRWR
ncbi:unnamed protein product [Musa acuminata subsp. burmannicoides]